MTITAAAKRDFDHAIAANMIQKDYGITVEISRDLSGFTNIRDINNPSTRARVSAIGLGRALDAFAAAHA